MNSERGHAMMLVISPGHWKVGTGAVGLIDEVTEARKVVQRISEIFKQHRIEHVTVVDQQSKNVRENLTYLIKEHQKHKATTNVSIHFNAVSGGVRESEIGCEVLYAHRNMESLAAKLSAAISKAGNLKDRGAKLRQDLRWLNAFSINGVLIEVCFVNSKKDVENYKQNFNQICWAIAECLAPKVAQKSPLSAANVQFSNEHIASKVEAILNDRAYVLKMLQLGVSNGAIQSLWIDKYRENLSIIDLLGLSFIILQKLAK
jgi:N-acetylmuramoyl-L-alanine amidase